jgi:ABC-2 type transport system ATP-binding protein
MRHLLLQLAEMGKTLLVTSHILPELSRICHQIAILTDGKLRAFGTLDEILRTISQERMIEVQLADASNLETAANVVREAVGEKSEVSVSQAVVRFRTGMTEQELGELLARLVRADAGVSQFRELQTNLEDAFLSVTQGAESQAGGVSETPGDLAELVASAPAGGVR